MDDTGSWGKKRKENKQKPESSISVYELAVNAGESTNKRTDALMILASTLLSVSGMEKIICH